MKFLVIFLSNDNLIPVWPICVFYILYVVHYIWTLILNKHKVILNSCYNYYTLENVIT